MITGGCCSGFLTFKEIGIIDKFHIETICQDIVRFLHPTNEACICNGMCELCIYILIL